MARWLLFVSGACVVLGAGLWFHVPWWLGCSAAFCYGFLAVPPGAKY